MTNKSIILVGSIVSLLLVALIAVGIYFDFSNTEVRLRNQITAKQRDNQSELDNMLKKISQTSQVTTAQAEALTKVVTGYAEARNTKGGGSLATRVQESIPNLDQTTYRNLMNVVTSSRDSFTMRQKEILDLKREHDNIRTTFPGSLVVGSRPEIEVKIVTSSRSSEAFQSGEDNDVTLFPKASSL